MLVTIIVSVLIFGYAAFVIRKKVKNVREGKFCSCGCGGCARNCKAKIPEE